MRPDVEGAFRVAMDLLPDEVPAFLGDMEQIRIVALARLISPVRIEHTGQDELLDIGEAAKRLGMSVSYVYRHHNQFDFTVRMGRQLRFSADGISRYIRLRSGT